MELKNIMTEDEMEQYLISEGYNIFDLERCIDSVLLSEYAIDLGYEIQFAENDFDLIFIKS